MNIYQSLNESINFIEKNLFEEKIDLKKAAGFLGTSLNNFKNTFSLLTGYTANEYIKLRRLSECIKLLPENKIVDIAVACGYNSRAAFSRAFKSFHGFTPSKFNENSNFNYFNKIYFNENITPYSSLKLKIKDVNKLTLYGESFKITDLNYIPKIWEDIKNKFPIFKNEFPHFGLIFREKNTNNFVYYAALNKKFSDSNKQLLIPASKYISASLESSNSKDISMLGKSIKSKSIYTHPDIEIYNEDEVKLLFKI